MSGAVGIETSQLTPRDHDAEEQRRAGITCADYVIRRDLDDGELLELLREVGLAHDPLALDRHPTSGNLKATHLRGPLE